MAAPLPRRKRFQPGWLPQVASISGIYNLTPEDHNGLDVDSMVIVQVKGGKFVMAE